MIKLLNIALDHCNAELDIKCKAIAKEQTVTRVSYQPEGKEQPWKGMPLDSKNSTKFIKGQS